MAAIPGIKYQDESIPTISANCFPVRSILRHGDADEVEGAWLVAHRAEQRKKFKAILCNKPKTYARIKEERRRAEKQGTTISEQNLVDEEEEVEEAPILDGFFLMKHCCVEDPTDLCSVNITGKEMSEVKEEDLALFDNVAYVNASENFLPLEAFRGFPILRELEMPLNGLRNVHPNLDDYPHLEVLDVSYNNLSLDDLLTIGLLPNLKVLHLTGNNLNKLPPNLAMPYYDEKNKREIFRYSKLEILLLDENNLSEVSVFAALAGIAKLKHLNLEKNELYYVPMLKSVEGKVVPNQSEKEMRRLRRSAEKSGRKSKASPREKTKRSDKRVREQEVVSTEPPKPTPVPVSKEPTEVLMNKTEPEAKPTSMTNGDDNPMDFYNQELASITAKIEEMNFEREDTPAQDDPERMMFSEGSSLPPFPDLRMLNLAHNKIEDEEALLAVAAWPMLVELIIHNNPLTTENSGDPPLLKRFLTDRLSIQITRKKEVERKKPAVEVKLKRDRQVSSVVPKIPKLSVDDLLMLEAPKPPSQPKPEKTRTRSDLQKPLPPIPSSPAQPKRTKQDTEHAQKDLKEEGKEGEEQSKPGDAFFMTQVDDQEAETGRKEEKKKKKHRHHKKQEKKTDDRYKGYEVLLDFEKDPDYNPPKDMHGNIKALKYALGHELIYRDPVVRLDRISKPVEPYRRTQAPVGEPRVTQEDKKDRVLEDMKNRETAQEAGLGEVLTGENEDLRNRFPDAQRLLGEIQRRYNTVRVNSMKDAREAKQALEGTISDAKKLDRRRVKMET